MVDAIEKEYLTTSKIQLFCIDSFDKESFSAYDRDINTRIENQEKYYHFIVDELVPLIHKINGTRRRILLTGCSLGAYHAANFFFRRPDIFEGCISLSGIYDCSRLLDYQMNPLIYDNSPIHCLQGMKKDHPYVAIYRKRVIILCVGKGRWEEDGLITQPILEQLLKEKDIPCFSDYWGYDVDHDWPWWKKQILYFLPMALTKIQKHP